MCIFCMCLRFIIYVWNRINAILNWCWWNLFRAGEMNSKKKHSKTQFSFWRVDSQLCWRDEHTEWTREIQIFISIVERLDKLKKRELRNIAIWKKDKKSISISNGNNNNTFKDTKRDFTSTDLQMIRMKCWENEFIQMVTGYDYKVFFFTNR